MDAVIQQPWQLAFDRQMRDEARSMRSRGVCPSCGEIVANGHFSDCAEHPKHALAHEFAEALQGDLSEPAHFVRPAIPKLTVADTLADALGDEQELLRKAMVILANCASGKGSQRDAQALIEQAVKGWAERNAE